MDRLAGFGELVFAPPPMRVSADDLWAVGVQVDHRLGQRDAVVVTMAPVVELSFEDLVGALFLWGEEETAELLVSDGEVRRLVGEAVVNWGSCELRDGRDEVERVGQTGSLGERAWVALCRRRVREVFAITPTPQTAPTATRQAQAGVPE